MVLKENSCCIFVEFKLLIQNKYKKAIYALSSTVAALPIGGRVCQCSWEMLNMLVCSMLDELTDWSFNCETGFSLITF